jgi:leucyl aminopeptidase
MKIHVIPNSNEETNPQSAWVIACFENTEIPWSKRLTDSETTALQAVVDSGQFSAKAQELYTLPTPATAQGAVMLLGLGTHEDFDAEILRRGAGKLVAALQTHRLTHVCIDATANEAIPMEAFIEGIMLAQYDFTTYKAETKTPVTLVDEIQIITLDEEGSVELREGCARAALTCANVNWARDMANTPPNDLTPTALAAQATEMAKHTGLKCTIFDESQIKALGLNGIAAVSQGSSEEARLIVLEYSHESADQTLALIGKGITFDTGGISIKPGEGMEEMKFDMCGAAAVLGAMKTIAELKPAVNVIGVVPAAENKTGSEAYVPGDIIKMYNGKTVEVHNTDAEGRMLLADALAYTRDKYNPNAMVNTATLTGAVVVALGHYAAGVFGNHDGLITDIQVAGDASGERVWPLPLWDDYCKLVEGTHADICNIGPRGEAGSITAAAFLKNFVGDTPWAHVDIAGTAWGGKHIPYWDPNHATGFGVRLFTQWILDVTADEA